MESSDGSIQSKASSEATTPTNGQDKKPFTYTPGGLDLSEIKSESMAKRLMKNAMNPGVQEVPRTANRSGSLPSGPPLHSYNLTSVPVLPNIQLPADPKSLLRQTSGPTNSSEVIDRILDDSIPFEIREEKKVNGSIIEGTPIVKNGTKESEDVETTVTINQTIRRNSEKLESSVEEVIEKLKMSLEEANKNLERVDTNDTKTKNSESYEEVSEEEVEEEVEEEEGDEEEEEVVESVTIVRKSVEQPKIEDEATVEKSKVNGQHGSEEEAEEEEEEEDGEEVVEEVKKTTTVVKTTVTKQEEEEEEEEVEEEEEEEAEYEEAISNPSPQPPPKEETEQSIDPVIKEVADKEEEVLAEDEENQSLKKEIKEENVELSEHSSKRSSIDATAKEESQNETETVEITITHKKEETEVKIEPREEQSESEPSSLRNINARLGELQNLPALDISPKRFSFLSESEERVHEYNTKTSTDSQDYTPNRQVRNVSPAYKTSQYQSPAFEKPIQKSYHAPPPSGVPKIFPQTQTQNVQREYQYAPQTQYQYQQPTQYYQQEQAQPHQAQPYQAPNYQAPQRVQEYQTYPSHQYQTPAPVQAPQRAQEYRSTQEYHSTETHTSQQYQPYYTESLTSQTQKQVEILPPWKTEETSQQPGNYTYENKPSFYGTAPTQKIEPPWKSSYAPPAESFYKPVSNSTTGVLNPLLNANKRNSWLQQTSIEQELSDPFSDPEPVWKRELREMATKPNDYYSDEIEPKVEVEPPWRRELREFSQRNNPQLDEPRLEPQSDEPPWMKEVKFRLTTYTQPEVPASNWQTQTIRPKTWREKSADLERTRSIEAPEWQKPNTLNRPRPLSTYSKSHLEPTTYLDTKTRGASMDRDTSRLPRPYQSSASNTSSHYSNGYSLPWEVSSNDSPMLSPTPLQYDRTPTPQSSSSPYRPPQQHQYTGYTQSPSSTNREYATLSYQPRGRNPNRTWPVQSRSFRYLQILTGTHDGYEDDEPFVVQAPLQSHPKPRPGPY